MTNTTTPESEQSIRNDDATRSELYRLASLVGTDAKTPFTKLCDFIDAYVEADRLRTAKEARMATFKEVLRSYPKKNRTMNDLSKLTRADIDRLITLEKEGDV